MKNKIDKALQIIHYGYSTFRNPVLLTSFGKDSMVMLDLLLKYGVKPDCIFYKESVKPKKYKFANDIIEQLELNVYNYPPYGVAWQESEDKTDFEIQCYYSNGEGNTVTCPIGLRKFKENEDYLCCLNLYNKPIIQADITYKWDCNIMGHRGDDKDPILGEAGCKIELLNQATAVKTIYPIVHFTEQDIWDYIEQENVPYNKLRYEKIDGTYRQKEDLTYNPDYFETCFECMRSDGETILTCPKTGFKIMNINHTLNNITPYIPKYIK